MVNLNGNACLGKGGDSGISKAMVLLVDGLDWRLVQRFLPHLPHLQKLQAAGVSARVLPFASTWGSPNFHALLTASPPGTCYRHAPLAGLAGAPRGDCAAETVPEALARSARRSVAVDFAIPGTSPLQLTIACPSPAQRALRMPPRIFQTADISACQFDPAVSDRSGWPPGNGPLPNRNAIVLGVPEHHDGQTIYRLPLRADLTWQAIALHGRVAVLRDGETTPVTTLEPGAWSPWIEGCLDGMRFLIRFRLLSLASDGTSMEIVSSWAVAPEGLAGTPELAGAVLSSLGPHPGGSPLNPRPEEPYTAVALEQDHAALDWVIDAAELAMRDFGADLFVHKTFIVDNPNHQCAAGMDPFSHRYDALTAPAYEAILRQAYMNFDACVGRLMDAAGRLGNTHVVVVGDHGICINNWVCDINRFLRDRGWLSFAADGSIDRAASQVYTRTDRQGNELYINRTLVTNDAAAAALQRKVIDALLDWRTPEGDRIICFALAKRDASIIGYWGTEAGDVLYTYNPGCTWGVNPGGATVAPSTALTTNHGAGIQTQDTGVTSNMGYFGALGPSIATSVARDEDESGPLPIHHVGAILCRMLGIDAPRHAATSADARFFRLP